MNKIIILCKILDSKQLYKLSDTVFDKFASKQSIMDKKIFIPYEIRKIAEEAYKKRLDKIDKVITLIKKGEDTTVIGSKIITKIKEIVESHPSL